MEELMKFLRMATTARLISWRPTGKEVSYDGSIYRGYETEINGFRIKTIISKRKLRHFSGLCWVVSIGKDDKKVFLTDTNSSGIVWLCIHIQTEMESKDIGNELRRRLAELMAK